MYTSAEIAQKIKITAKSKNVIIKDMLAECGLSKNALSSMSSGGSTPKSENLAKIADCLGVSVDYLLGRTDEPKTETSDPTTQILVEHFNNLSSDDKIAVLNIVLEKSKK